MSGPNKSLDKNKRFAGVKTNEFVNKTRANEVNRSAVRPQGWANLGKINSRRIPPPANLPSLKSETGVNSPAFDPTTVPSNHTWTSNENPQSPNLQTHPTQQQLDSLPVNSPTPPTSADIDKSRLPSSWSTITAGTTTEQTPNRLALNDFPRLETTPTVQDKKSQSDMNSPSQNPTFRPANLATWKDGGVATSRQQSSVNNSSQNFSTNPGANQYQQPQNMRMYQPQMWNYNPYHHHQQQQQPVPLMPPTHQRINQMNDYKTPTILRNKDIEDLSKLTDNTWANTTQEVNYEEKIRFSDDEDFLETNIKPTIRQSNHKRLIQDDEHLKQMQNNKNSELINALNIAKQRRDEQERHLRNEQQIMSNYDEQKSLPGYQTRPLLSSATMNEQENNSTSRSNTNSSSFAMKSWSDQMDSFNYSSLHESNLPNQHSPSQSESSSQSLSKLSKLPNNDQWENWPNETNENRQVQKPIHSNDLTKPKTTRTTKQTTHRTNENQQESSSYKPQKQRYQPTPLIDTASIPPLMSVRSDLPSTDYYENENLYYDTNQQHYHQTNVHNRGYTTLGSYGRYRRSGTHRQQQYSNYNTNPTTSVSSAPINRSKKNGNSNKKPESNTKEETAKKSSIIDDESIVKPLQSLVLSPKIDNEKINGSKNGLVEQKSLPESSSSNLSTNKIDQKKTSTAKTQKRTTKEQQQQQQQYQTQQAPRHRNNYLRSTQEYDSTQNYYNAARRTGQNTRHNHQHDLSSSAYYYDQSQSHYNNNNNRYNYSTDSYHQQSKSTRQKRSQQLTTKTPNTNTTSSSNNNNNNNNIRHHSTSDNDQKEGEEWETASESSTNMRNGHYENTAMNEIKMNNNHRGRTPPKKSFSNQRPNARQIFKYTNA